MRVVGGFWWLYWLYSLSLLFCFLVWVAVGSFRCSSVCLGLAADCGGELVRIMDGGGIVASLGCEIGEAVEAGVMEVIDEGGLRGGASRAVVGAGDGLAYEAIAMMGGAELLQVLQEACAVHSADRASVGSGCTGDLAARFSSRTLLLFFGAVVRTFFLCIWSRAWMISR